MVLGFQNPTALMSLAKPALGGLKPPFQDDDQHTHTTGRRAQNASSMPYGALPPAAGCNPGPYYWVNFVHGVPGHCLPLVRRPNSLAVLTTHYHLSQARDEQQSRPCGDL